MKLTRTQAQKRERDLAWEFWLAAKINAGAIHAERFAQSPMEQWVREAFESGWDACLEKKVAKQ